jgi:hypothetical protein
MVRNKTVLVLGAGASKEAGIPLGGEITGQIASACDFVFEFGDRRTRGDGILLDAIRFEAQDRTPTRPDPNPWVRAARRIAAAMPQAMSIDSFVDQHSHDRLIEQCAKFAIVRVLLQAEKNSTLYVRGTDARPRLNFPAVQNTWYAKFWTVLTEGCRLVELPERLSSFAFIVFNYDRCLEHFLYHSIQNYYGATAQEAAEIVKSAAIYHPYGVTGSLEWQTSEPRIAFGDDPYAAQIRELSTQIKTFTEGTDPTSSNIVEIKNKMAEADLVVFLGFAFHRQNMQLLAPSEDTKPRVGFQDYLATAHGMSQSDSESIEEALPRVFRVAPRRIGVHNKLTCSGLFDEYRRTFALSE